MTHLQVEIINEEFVRRYWDSVCLYPWDLYKNKKFRLFGDLTPIEFAEEVSWEELYFLLKRIHE